MTEPERPAVSNALSIYPDQIMQAHPREFVGHAPQSLLHGIVDAPPCFGVTSCARQSTINNSCSLPHTAVHGHDARTVIRFVMPKSPTVGELLQTRAVTDKQVNLAVEVYLTDLKAGTFQITDGYIVDLDAAVAEHPWASLVVPDVESSPSLKRGIVRMAILMTPARKV